MTERMRPYPPPPSGWYVFGTHSGWDAEDMPEKFEFSEEVDDALMPLYERPVVDETMYKVSIIPGGKPLKYRQVGGKKYTQYAPAMDQFERLVRNGHDVRILHGSVSWKVIKEIRSSL